MGFDRAEVRRVARLARLELGDAEAEGLAADLAAITASFSALADFAATLPPADEPAPGALRPDEPAPSDEAEAIRAAVPRLDASGAIRVPRGPA